MELFSTNCCFKKPVNKLFFLLGMTYLPMMEHIGDVMVNIPTSGQTKENTNWYVLLFR